MIGLYQNQTGSEDTRLLQTYNGLSLNNPADSPTDTYEVNSVQPLSTFDSVTDAHPDDDGIEAYGVRKVQKIIRVTGVIRAPNKKIDRLFDKIEDLAVAFDPALVTHNNPSVQGFLPYDFSTPTEDLTNYLTGLMACRYYARALRTPEPEIDYARGNAASWSVDLLLRDPRRYLQALSSRDGAGTADNTKADYRSWPTVTIAATGAGSAALSIENSTVARTLVLDLSGLINLDSVVVDMEGRAITKNGLDAMDLYVSGDYWWMEPGNNVIAIANGTNVSVTTAWRSAFAG